MIGTRLRKKRDHGISVQSGDHHNCSTGAGNSPSNTKKETLFQKNEKGLLFFFFILMTNFYIKNLYKKNVSFLLSLKDRYVVRVENFFQSDHYGWVKKNAIQ